MSRQTGDESQAMRLPFWPFGGERSACLVKRDTLADIKPSFENDTNIVLMPPEESAFSNREKVIERDVEVYRKKA
jgi:hypothetical protein